MPLEYSASDYHHVAKPAPLFHSHQHSSNIPSPKHRRQPSHFSIVTDSSGPRNTYYKDPVTSASTTTKGSYDPYRSSRTPLVGTRTHDTKSVTRKGSAASRSYQASHAAEMRSAAVNQIPTRGRTCRAVSPATSYRASRHQEYASGTGHSRSSLASTRWREGGIRKSASHKRQVSFSHVRRKSPGHSLRTRDTARAASTKTDFWQGRGVSHELSQSQSTPSLPSPPRETISPNQASELGVRKGRALSNQGREEAQKLSSELGKICEEAFNRSSVSPGGGTAHEGGLSSSPDLIEAENTPAAAIRDTALRPLPRTPAESLGSYTVRELTETRRRLLQHCQSTGAEHMPDYLADVVAHLDRLMQAALPPQHGPQLPEKRSASDPSSTKAKIVSHPLSSRENGYHDFHRTDAQGNRSASDPPKSVPDATAQGLGKTVRIVPPDTASQIPLPNVAPLHIRRNGPTPARIDQEASDSRVLKQTSAERRNYTGLDTIEEVACHTRGKDSPESPGSGRKWSWFKRTSDLSHETPPTPPQKDTLTPYEKGSTSEQSVGNTALYDSNFKHQQLGQKRTANTEENGLIEGKRTWFSKMLRKRAKSRGSGRTTHVVVTEVGSDSESHLASTENLFSGPQAQTGEKEQLSPPSGQESNPNKQPYEGGNSTVASRLVPTSHNWFTKFFRVRPASHIICLCISKAKARRTVLKILREWRRYGLRDVLSERNEDGDVVKAKVDSVNRKCFSGPRAATS